MGRRVVGVRRNEDLSPVARTSLCTTPKADGVSIPRADNDMLLLAGCHSRRQRRVLRESPISSRGQIPRHLPRLLGRQTTLSQVSMSTEPLAPGTSNTLLTLRLSAEFYHELQDVVQENRAGAVWI